MAAPCGWPWGRSRPTTDLVAVQRSHRPGRDAGQDPLALVRLRPLMDRTAGRPDVIVGLVDGPVALAHPDLAAESVRAPAGSAAACRAPDQSCIHGTYVAGILTARRGTAVPAICPGCTLLVRPIFGTVSTEAYDYPSATHEELVAALVECMEHGARVINVSAALTEARTRDREELTEVLDLAARRGVLVVVAAGNQKVVAGSTLTRHRWVLPVVAYSLSGRPLDGATLGSSIGRGGLGGPGETVVGLAPGGGTIRLGGSSAAAPFVTGAAALIWSELPKASGAQLRLALVNGSRGRRRAVVPPLLDAWSSYRGLRESMSR